MKCTFCGANDLEQGFLPNSVDVASHRQAHWVEGPVEHALFGGIKLRRRRRLPIAAFRCRKCSHLEFFADPEPDDE
ncbi:hypothetical protein E1288_23885 [Saccharopolyspora elongata]|uniref:Uncharacterized protein n=1 Tax=Saccharopolyspora elongata TaxID=2530387 RepID=A0A4R4YR75_9PSEU|nr:hypothetical protein E1288_23885 [Saccharopolyspora elongata]